MDKIHLIMPMAGGGSRFGNKGFNLPKPLIELQKRPFFYWAVQSVKKFMDVKDITFVVLQEHIDKFKIDMQIKEYYPSAYIQKIPRVLDGAVLTCCEGIKVIEDDLPILFNDCDHAFICESFYEYCQKGNLGDIDGALLTFVSENPNYSYVQFDAQGTVIGTIEKVVASRNAICGAYYFRNKQIFSEGVEAYLKKCAYNEFFVSGVYNELAAKKKKLVIFSIDEHISFGTPEEYELAINDDRLGVLVE